MAQNNIKKIVVLYGVICALVVSGCARKQQNIPLYDTVEVVENTVIDENSVPIFPKKAALTTDTAQTITNTKTFKESTIYNGIVVQRDSNTAGAFVSFSNTSCINQNLHLL